MPRYSDNPPPVVLPDTDVARQDLYKGKFRGAVLCPDYERGDGLDVGLQYAMPVKNPCANRELHANEEMRAKSWCLSCLAGLPVISLD